MHWRKVRQKLINFLPIRCLRSWLSFYYGWFPGSKVQPDVNITGFKNLKVGKGVYIGGGGTAIHCIGGVTIGSGTAIGEGCFIISSNHNYKSSQRVPFDHVVLLQPVEIGKNCWLGARSMVCPGVKIDDGVVVAMGSVVTKSVPKCAIVGGNPAKIIGWRDKELYEKLANEGMVYYLKDKLPQEYILKSEHKKYLDDALGDKR